MDLAKRLLIYRIKKDLTQKEMAEKLGISDHTLCDIERERDVMLKTKLKVELKLNELEKEDKNE